MYVVFVGKEENVVKTPLECNLSDTLKDVYSEGNSVLSQSDYTAISHSLKSRNVKLVVEAILKADSFNKHLENHLVKTSAEKINQMLNKKHGFVSTLMNKTFDDLVSFSWSDIVLGESEQFPLLMKLLLCMMVPFNVRNMESKITNIIPRLGMIYGIVAQGRNHELSKVQRIISVNLADNNADQKVMSLNYDTPGFFFLLFQYRNLLKIKKDK